MIRYIQPTERRVVTTRLDFLDSVENDLCAETGAEVLLEVGFDHLCGVFLTLWEIMSATENCTPESLVLPNPTYFHSCGFSI